LNGYVQTIPGRLEFSQEALVPQGRAMRGCSDTVKAWVNEHEAKEYVRSQRVRVDVLQNEEMHPDDARIHRQKPDAWERRHWALNPSIRC